MNFFFFFYKYIIVLFIYSSYFLYFLLKFFFILLNLRILLNFFNNYNKKKKLFKYVTNYTTVFYNYVIKSIPNRLKNFFVQKIIIEYFFLFCITFVSTFIDFFPKIIYFFLKKLIQLIS